MRFFHATVMAGSLHLLDIGDLSLWQPERIAYKDEETLNMLGGRLIFRKARMVEELDAALESSRETPGSITVYVSEQLLDAAKERWEEMQKHLR